MLAGVFSLMKRGASALGYWAEVGEGDDLLEGVVHRGDPTVV